MVQVYRRTLLMESWALFICANWPLCHVFVRDLRSVFVVLRKMTLQSVRVLWLLCQTNVACGHCDFLSMLSNVWTMQTAVLGLKFRENVFVFLNNPRHTNTHTLSHSTTCKPAQNVVSRKTPREEIVTFDATHPSCLLLYRNIGYRWSRSRNIMIILG